MNNCYIINGPTCTNGTFNFEEFFFSAGPFSTTSTSYVPAATFTTDAMALGGDYLIEWNCTYTNSANNSRVSIRVQIDNTITINDHEYGVRGAPRVFTASGRRVITLASGSHTIDVDYAAFSATATIEQIEIFIYRVS